MNGAKGRTNGPVPATNGSGHSENDLETTAAARDRFAAGADTVQGVRPEILMSWYRCRDEYGVDPQLERAPAAAEGSTHSIEHDVVFAELGGLAASAVTEVENLDGVVTVTDSGGRVLGTWGGRRMLSVAADNNLAPWFTWAEWASGTNGMGTALESHHPVLVRGPEHWCRAFDAFTCAGVAVRDVVTHEPIAVLNVVCRQTPLPEAALPWLGRAAAVTEATLRQRARHAGALLTAAFADARVAPGTPLAVVDPAGNVVLANNEAAVLLGTPADTPAHAPTHRWAPAVPALRQLARRVTERAGLDRGWSGSTRVHVPFLDAPMPVAVRPVFDGSQVIGALLLFGLAEEPSFGIPPDDAEVESPAPRPARNRVVALRDDRWVLLDPREIRFAEADHGNVWLISDQGRLLSTTRCLDQLEQELTDRGFVRVHRRFLVNLGRIREIEQGFKGALLLATDTRAREIIPVARRQVPQVRQALGL